MENKQLDQKIRKILKEESIQIPTHIEHRWKETLATLPEKKTKKPIYKKLGLSAAILFLSLAGYSILMDHPEEKMYISKESLEKDSLVEGKLSDKNQEINQTKNVDVSINDKALEQRNEVETVPKAKDTPTEPVDKQSPISEVNETNQIDKVNEVDAVKQEIVKPEEIPVLPNEKDVDINTAQGQPVLFNETGETYAITTKPLAFDLEKIYAEFSSGLFLFDEKKFKEISVKPETYQIQSNGQEPITLEMVYTLKDVNQAFILRQTKVDDEHKSNLLKKFSDSKNLNGENLYESIPNEEHAFYVSKDQSNAQYYGEMIVDNQWIQIQGLSSKLTKEEVSLLMKALKFEKQQKS